MVPFVPAELLGTRGELACGHLFLAHFYDMLSKEPKEALRDAPKRPRVHKAK